MGSLFLVLSLVLVLSLSTAVCITANAKVKWYNLLIGSLIIYFCFLFSYLLSADIFYVLVVCIFSCLFNSFFYTNYELSSKNILIFFLYLAYILFIEGIKFEIYALFNEYRPSILNICIVLISIILLLLLSLILRFCIRRVRLSSYIYRCRLEFENMSVDLELYLDSGNFLKFGNDEVPVVIVSKSKLKNIEYSEIKQMSLKGTFSQESTLTIIIPNAFEINIKGRWRKKSVAVGIVDKDFVFYDGLIGLGCIN